MQYWFMVVLKSSPADCAEDKLDNSAVSKIAAVLCIPLIILVVEWYMLAKLALIFKFIKSLFLIEFVFSVD